MDEDYEDDNESEPLILSIGDDGKGEIHKQGEYMQMLNTDFERIQGFIEENKSLFDEYMKKYKK